MTRVEFSRFYTVWALILGTCSLLTLVSKALAEEVTIDFDRLPFDGVSSWQTTAAPYQEDGFEIRIVGNDQCPPSDASFSYPTPLSSYYTGTPSVTFLGFPTSCPQWEYVWADIEIAAQNGSSFDLLRLSAACQGPCGEGLNITGQTVDGRTVSAQCVVSTDAQDGMYRRDCSFGSELRGLSKVSWREYPRAQWLLVDDIVLSTGEPPPPAPWISAAPSNVDFEQVVANGHKELGITVSNIGGADLDISEIAINNPLAPPFSVSSDSCTGMSVAPDGECTVTVSFEPAGAGTYSDTFSIASNDPFEPTLELSLVGQAVVLGGEGFGLDVVSVTCTNKTQRVKIEFGVSVQEEGAWDCQTAGLPVDSGDEVTMKVKGIAK